MFIKNGQIFLCIQDSGPELNGIQYIYEVLCFSLLNNLKECQRKFAFGAMHSI